MAEFYIGSMERPTATFYNDADPPVPTNTTVVVDLLKPDGTRSNPVAVNDGPGVYHFDIVYDQEGPYVWHFRGTGAVTASKRGERYVTRSEVLP